MLNDSGDVATSKLAVRRPTKAVLRSTSSKHRKNMKIAQVNSENSSIDSAHKSQVGSRRNSKTNRIRTSVSAARRGSTSKMYSLAPLQVQFSKYATFASPVKAHRPRSKSIQDIEDSQEEETQPTRITLDGIQLWFEESKIFTTPQCKISIYDLRTMFERLQKSSISYKEFIDLIADLAELRKVEADMILLKLRLSSNPRLNARILHLQIPEGYVDRVVDAFRFDAKNVWEEFLNLSKGNYEEPVCFGGIPRPFGSKSKEEEEAMLTAIAKRIMKQGSETRTLSKLEKNFIYFAKNGNYYSDGRSIELVQLIRWMRQAGIIDGRSISTLDVSFLFKRLYTPTSRIYFDDLVHVLEELSVWKNVPTQEMFEKLKKCDVPASSSMSLITMGLKPGLVELIKQALLEYWRQFDEQRSQYEITTAEGPFGHTANSRNRHFSNYIEANPFKVHSSTVKEILKKRGHHDELSKAMVKKKNHELDEKDEKFSEEKRSTKDFTTKRWHDAYPIGGMEAVHRPRVEPAFEKRMFGVNSDSSSDDELDFMTGKATNMKYKKRKSTFLRRKSNYAPTNIDVQFEKYKNFGSEKTEEGISFANIELWFSLAGFFGPPGVGLMPLPEFHSKLREYKRSRMQYLNFEEFTVFLDFLALKKSVDTKDLIDVLTKSGPPRLTSSKHRQPPLDGKDEGRQERKYLTSSHSSIASVVSNFKTNSTVSITAPVGHENGPHGSQTNHVAKHIETDGRLSRLSK